MSEYMIMTDSTVDLPKEYLTEELGFRIFLLLI